MRSLCPLMRFRFRSTQQRSSRSLSVAGWAGGLSSVMASAGKSTVFHRSGYEQQVRTVLQPYCLRMAVVFGSIARGDAGHDSDLHSVGELLLGRIVSEGRLVMGDTDDWGQLIYRHLVNQADFVPLQNRILKTRRDAWIKQSSTGS